MCIRDRRDSAWGATLDSVVDRISEAFWLYALYAVGVPAWLSISLWSISAFQEYARAKLVSLGVSDIGIVTPAERPMRASFIFIILILALLDLPGVVLAASIFLVVQIVSFLMVVRYARLQLR